MLTHEKVWMGIDRLAAKYGYSPSGLARQAGLDPTSFNKSKRHSPDGKPRWPSTESLSKVLAVTGSTMNEFIALIQNEPAPHQDKDIAARAASILLDTQSVLLNAHDTFTLTSGRTSPVYVDCRRLISFVQERETLMDMAAAKLVREIGAENIDYIAGGETAGIPYAAFLAERLAKPMLYIRKKPKGFGRMAQIEGHLPEKGPPKVLLVEDLQTDGGSKEVFINALRDAGAQVDHAFVVFHYGIFPQSENNMKEWGVNLHTLATWHDVLAEARQRSDFDKGTLDQVQAFIDAPHEWGEVT